ncbi:glutathione S-transferase family protein [Rhizobium sp. L1K21]|uniref:glutathione S-transferase family protein n=1 Tax=Rhizobium sp. L1K21 TaxID=2954933 RepID=UPI00209219A2|nr:glutathione S-transferase family protein [Rhizobium sp. L1K21]MCO6186493.1 glutathione S-transferase family protein [Rhizobium sp. L1K21]
MKILYSPASPYSAKVRLAAQYCGFDAQSVSVVVNTGDSPELLVSNNPLGKIPTLLTVDGKAIFDSRAIMQFLNRESGGKLYPEDPAARTDAEVLEALSDGITDCLIAQIYEKRFHPPEKIHQPWIDMQWTKVARGLDHLQAHPPSLESGLNGGHLSLFAMAGYLALRFAGQWEERWPWINTFVGEFTKAYPELATLAPQ